MRRSIALVVVLASAAHAQELQHPSGADPYRGWLGPSGIDCCSGQHCVAADPCRTETGQEGWLEDGRCWALDPTKWSVPPVPVLMSGQPLHVCRSFERGPDGRISNMFLRCWYAGLGS